VRFQIVSNRSDGGLGGIWALSRWRQRQKGEDKESAGMVDSDPLNFLPNVWSSHS